jgi:uncharacterized membrane protein
MGNETVTPAPGRWWQALLIASLAINLLIGGAVATRFVMHSPPERLVSTRYAQPIPKRVLAEIPRDRRRVMLDILKKYRDGLRSDREASEQVASKLADAITIEAYDVEKVQQVVSEFAGQNGKLAARGGDAAMEILALLSPEERQMLAAAIREGADRGK